MTEKDELKKEIDKLKEENQRLRSELIKRPKPWKPQPVISHTWIAPATTDTLYLKK